MAYPRSGLDQYKSIDTYSGVAYADPHRLVQMLMDGAIDRMAQAKGSMLQIAQATGEAKQKEVATKGELISKAISIIDGLRVSLDHQQGGEIADNLEGLYRYMQRRLLEANMRNEPEALEEVSSLLKEIRSAWVAIPQDERAPNSPETTGTTG